MNNRAYCITLLLLLFSFNTWSKDNKEVTAIKEVINRVTGRNDLSMKISLVKKDGMPFYEYSVKDGVLNLKGNNSISICRGFYDYVKKNHYGLYSWSGSNIQFPQKLPEMNTVFVESPFENHYYLNVVTYAYSTPYWNWERWEKEIDWMAVHGINMPLALIAHEAIMARVYRKLGFSEETIDRYFVGPAHLPFSRMGLIESLDGPLDKNWYDQTIELQHLVLKRMRSLGIKPICPAFAGFVPGQIKELYPDVKVVKTHWGGAFNNWMISPEEPLFSELSTAYIDEWEKEFGECTYYLSDSFNEMEIPFPPKGNKERYELLAHYGDVVYKSIIKANPKAVWVMQGWMFGYQRHIWDYETLQALVSKVPDDKMVLLDLAVDYNKHFWGSQVNWDFYKGFFNKKWIYSVIPNMGGKVGLTGVLDFYANGHLEALNSVNKGNLIGHGSAPEGIENNEVIYELLSDAGWSNKPIVLSDWLQEYSNNRYGGCTEEILQCWKHLQNSVYGSFTDHPRYNWQFRPGSMKNGSIRMNESFFKAVESFADAADSFRNSTLYLHDLAEFTALYLGGKAEILVNAIEAQYEKGDTLRAIKFEKDFLYILSGIDRILTTHPTLSLERWIDLAQQQGKSPEKKIQYERNARRIVTIWGPPVDDYSARLWSGLVRDYYLPRWQHYFDSRKSGIRFDFPTWERKWVESSGLSSAKKLQDLINEVRLLIDYCAFITLDLSTSSTHSLASWNVKAGEESEFIFNIPANQLHQLKSVLIEGKGQKGDWSCTRLELLADGLGVFSKTEIENKQANKRGIYVPIVLPADIRANNGCVLKISIKNIGKQPLSGVISLNKSN